MMYLVRSAGRFLQQAFTENVGIKALSLSFALGLFVYLHAQDYQKHSAVPVGLVLRLPPESAKRELKTRIPHAIHVTMQGSTRAWEQLNEGNGIPPVEVDLRGGEKDRIVFDEAMFSIPPGLDITIIDPRTIPLEWEDVVSREIPIQASITGQPAEGFVVKGEPEVTPEMIQVEGPESDVEVMQFARVSAFDVSGLSEGVYRRRLAIDEPRSRVNFLGPQNTTVVVTIARRMSEAKFTNRPVEVIGVPRATAAPTTVDVTVVGPPEVVRALRADQVVPHADVSKVPNLDLEASKHGSARVPVTVELANAEAEIQPPSVTVKW